jgi:hypothetical protein
MHSRTQLVVANTDLVDFWLCVKKSMTMRQHAALFDSEVFRLNKTSPHTKRHDEIMGLSWSWHHETSFVLKELISCWQFWNAGNMPSCNFSAHCRWVQNNWCTRKPRNLRAAPILLNKQDKSKVVGWESHTTELWSSHSETFCLSYWNSFLSGGCWMARTPRSSQCWPCRSCVRMGP